MEEVPPPKKERTQTEELPGGFGRRNSLRRRLPYDCRFQHAECQVLGAPTFSAPAFTVLPNYEKMSMCA